ncbi:MAG: putative toxin-antitoxin system toxin component, PIN family [Thermoplasmataceae archaeon]
MKVITDSNVFFRAILGRKAGTASKSVISLIREGRITSYTCDALMGEIGRIVKSDPKLRKIDPVYFRQFMDDVDGWLSYVPMKDLEHDQKMLNRIGNDWYLIAISRSISANYIITYDKELISIKKELKSQDEVEVLTSEEFMEQYKR